MQNEISNDIDSGMVERVIDAVEGSLEGLISRPSRAKWFLVGAALGSLAVIFLDPVHGEKRRTAVKEKVTKWGTEGMEFGRSQIDNIKNRAQSVTSAVSDQVSPQNTH